MPSLSRFTSARGSLSFVRLKCGCGSHERRSYLRRSFQLALGPVFDDLLRESSSAKKRPYHFPFPSLLSVSLGQATLVILSVLFVTIKPPHEPLDFHGVCAVNPSSLTEIVPRPDDSSLSVRPPPLPLLHCHYDPPRGHVLRDAAQVRGGHEYKGMGLPCLHPFRGVGNGKHNQSRRSTPTFATSHLTDSATPIATSCNTLVPPCAPSRRSGQRASALPPPCRTRVERLRQAPRARLP